MLTNFQRTKLSTRTVVALWLALTACAIVLFPPSGARFFARAVEASQMTSTTATAAETRQTFWAKEEGFFLFKVSSPEAASNFRLQLPSAQSGEIKLASQWTVDHTWSRAAWHLVSGPVQEGSAVLAIEHGSAAPPHLEIYRVSGAYVLLRTTAICGALLTGALALALALHSRRRLLAASILLAAVCWVIYASLSAPALDNRNDNELYVPSSLSLLREGNLELNEWRPSHLLSVKDYRRYAAADGQVYNNYPIGTSILTAPLAGTFFYLLGDIHNERERLVRTADLVAATLAAIAVALVVPIAFCLGLPLFSALMVGLIFAFATPHWPSHGVGLWSSNLSTVLLLASFLLTVQPNRKLTWTAAIPLACAVLTRPTAILMYPFIGLLQLRRGVRSTALWSAASLVLAGVVAGIHLLVFDQILPPYYGKHLTMLSFDRLKWALLGLLVSPNRGLLIFMPIAAASMIGAALCLRTRNAERKPILAAAGFVATYLGFVSTFNVWWGGGSYGPRLLAETFPFLCLMLVPLLLTIAGLKQRLRAISLVVLVALAGWGAFAAYRGATDPATRDWNRWPKRVVLHKERLWDWTDLQILRGLGPHEPKTALTGSR